MYQGSQRGRAYHSRTLAEELSPSEGVGECSFLFWEEEEEEAMGYLVRMSEGRRKRRKCDDIKKIKKETKKGNMDLTKKRGKGRILEKILALGKEDLLKVSGK